MAQTIQRTITSTKVKGFTVIDGKVSEVEQTLIGKHDRTRAQKIIRRDNPEFTAASVETTEKLAVMDLETFLANATIKEN